MFIPRRIVVACVLVVLAVLAVDAKADPVVINWTIPTVYEGGAPIPATGSSAVKDIRISWGICGQPKVHGMRVIPVPATSVTMDFARDIEWCYSLTAMLNNGMASQESSETHVLIPSPVVPPPRPAAPVPQAP